MLTPSALVLTREALYDRVWSTPLTRLARELGLSDVALAKHCRRRAIPLPGRGHWAKAANGNTPSPKPLPPLTHNQPQPATFIPVSAPLLLASETPARLDPLAERLRHRLHCLKKDARGLVHIRDRDLPAITASPAQSARLARFLHHVAESLRALNAQPFADEGTLAWMIGTRRTYLTITERCVPTERNGIRRLTPAGEFEVVIHQSPAQARHIWSFTESLTLSLDMIASRIAACLTRTALRHAPRQVAPEVRPESRIEQPNAAA